MAKLPSNKIIDLTGIKIGRWTVKEFSHLNEKRKAYWSCRCGCGNERIVSAASLRSGNSQSCGCYNIECIKQRNKNLKSKPNEYRFDREVGKCKLHNAEFLFDKDDYEFIKQYQWRLNQQGYVVTNKGRLHRLLLGLSDNRIEVDHINGDQLDNRRCNLRTCSRQENVRNRLAKGYRLHCGKYQARIMVNRKEINLGRFATEKEAKRTYIKANKQIFGEFSRYKTEISA